MIAATRLRGGNAASCRGAASFAKASVHADSAFYSSAFTGAVRAAGAFFSVTMRADPKVRAAIDDIGETGWRPIEIPPRHQG